WFHLMEFESFDGRTLRTSLPTKFLQTWIQAHYADSLLECCKTEFTGAERLDIVVREYGAAGGRSAATAVTPGAGHGGPAPAADAGTVRADRRQRLRGLAARSEVYLRQLRGRQRQPHGADGGPAD